jgi:hypothetical protein
MEATIIVNFDLTSTSSIGGAGGHKYWPIGAWLEFESCSINFQGLPISRFEGL